MRLCRLGPLTELPFRDGWSDDTKDSARAELAKSLALNGNGAAVLPSRVARYNTAPEALCLADPSLPVEFDTAHLAYRAHLPRPRAGLHLKETLVARGKELRRRRAPGVRPWGERPRAPEGNGHGTHVSAIISGNGALGPPGIAPEASLVGVRVFDDRAAGRVSDWVAALDRVAANREVLRIKVVNLSLGHHRGVRRHLRQGAAGLTAAVELLRASGVIAFAATGNDGRADAMSAPTCIGAVVAVGATYDTTFERQPSSGTYACGCADEAPDAGVVAFFSNGGEALDLLAPGARNRRGSAPAHGWPRRPAPLRPRRTRSRQRRCSSSSTRA